MSVELEKILISSCSRVVNQFRKHDQLCKQLIEIKDAALLISKESHHYDFPGVEYNGFRYIVKTTIKLFQTISSKYDQEPDKEIIKLIYVSHCSLRYFKTLLNESSKLPLNFNGSRSIITDDYQLVIEAFKSFLETNGCDLLCNKLAAFHLPKPEGPAFQLVFHWLLPIVASSTIWSGIATLFDYKLRRKAWRDAFTNFTLGYIKAIDIHADSYFNRKFLPLFQVSLFHPNICRDIHVPRQNLITIQLTLPEQKVQLVKKDIVISKYSRKRTVRCRLLMESSRREVSQVISLISCNLF